MIILGREHRRRAIYTPPAHPSSLTNLLTRPHPHSPLLPPPSPADCKSGKCVNGRCGAAGSGDGGGSSGGRPNDGASLNKDGEDDREVAPFPKTPPKGASACEIEKFEAQRQRDRLAQRAELRARRFKNARESEAKAFKARDDAQNAALDRDGKLEVDEKQEKVDLATRAARRQGRVKARIQQRQTAAEAGGSGGAASKAARRADELAKKMQVRAALTSI